MHQSREFYGKGTLAEELDFALFEVDEKRIERENIRREERKKAREEAVNRENLMKKNREKQAENGRKKNQPLTIVDKYGIHQIAAVVLVSVIIIALLAVMVANQQRINEINHDIENLNADITALEQDYEVMKINFESKMSDAAIEQYAREVLGMQHRENNQTEWLNLNNTDIFEDCEAESSPIFFWNNH